MHDVSKHVEVFKPSWVTGNIGIIGVGSIGSALAINIAKLGLTNRVILFDPDVVEAHNISNQFLYGVGDIGKWKVDAAYDSIELLTDDDCTKNRETRIRVSKRSDITSLGIRYLFVCVDSMRERKSIFQNCVWMNPQLAYFSEARMNAREGSVYSFNPLDLTKAEEYTTNHLYEDDEVPRISGGCSITQSIGATAMTLACQMTWNFMDYLSGDETRKPPEEIALRVPNLTVYAKGELTPSE